MLQGEGAGAAPASDWASASGIFGVFFIAKGQAASSIRVMIPRVLMVLSAMLVAATLSSCCCLF